MTRYKQLLILFFVIAIILFIWPINHFFKQYGIGFPVNTQLFSDFGTFIAGIFSIVSVILLIDTLRLTREQSFDNKFFNCLSVHNSIIEGLRVRKIDKIKQDWNIVEEKEFFELMYDVLDQQYKKSTKIIQIEKLENVTDFFVSQNWLMGHYFRSFISIVELVDNQSDLDHKKKEFYLGVLQARSSSDELRFVFYYVVSRYYEMKRKEDNAHIETEKIQFIEKKDLALKTIAMFRSYNFFNVISDPLIYVSEDWKLFDDI